MQKKNHPDVVDLHQNQDEDITNKKHHEVVAHLHQSYHQPNQKQDDQKKNQYFLTVPIKTAVEASNHITVDDEEGLRKYEKNIICSESSSCKNGSNNVKVL